MSADRGDSTAMFNYASMLESGDGIAANAEEAARYYKMAADSGNQDALNKLNNQERRCTIW